jgi:putative transposase
MGNSPVVVKLRLHVDEEKRSVLDSQSRKCNWLYNHLLERANRLREQYRETPTEEISRVLYTKRGLRNLIPELKEEKKFLKTVHSSPLKNTALRLSESIQAYQKARKKEGKVRGWPRFRSWKADWFSLLYDEPKKGWKLKGNRLRLSLGAGKDRKRQFLEIGFGNARALRGKKIRNLRIVCQAGFYSAVFTVERELPEKKPIKKVMALDPNHRNLSYGVGTDGQAIEIESPWWLKKYDRRIDELKAKRDRCQKRSRLLDVLDDDVNATGKQHWEPSKRWKKLDGTLKRALAKRRDQTKTFLYTVANGLLRKYDLVAIGDYTPRGGGITMAMRRAMNNRSLIGRFKQVVSWCAAKSGKFYYEYPEEGTTRTCHKTGYVVEGGIPPSERVWSCPGCGGVHIRDENAAINGLKRVLEDWKRKDGELSLSVPGSGLDSVRERWAWRVRPSEGLCPSRGMDCGQTASARKLNRGCDNPRSMPV